MTTTTTTIIFLGCDSIEINQVKLAYAEKQAGAELGQAQLQLELGFTLLSWVCL